MLRCWRSVERAWRATLHQTLQQITRERAARRERVAEKARSNKLGAIMQRQPRLSRSEVVAGLRAIAREHGAVSARLVAQHDRRVARSLRLHFPTFATACRAARVEIAAPPRRERRRDPRWSRAGVVEALQQIDGGGGSTGWAEVMEGGGGVIQAAAVHAGGLVQARTAAGVTAPPRRPPVVRWDRDTIAKEIRDRARSGQTLASSKAPQRFVAAARWHFGSWEAALSAAGVDPDAARLQRGRYTADEILDIIRALARDGAEVRPSTLRPVVKLDTVRRLFGSIDAAVRAAGIQRAVTHGNQKWSRERVIDELKARAARGEARLTRGLHRAAQLYFGGAHAARDAAGLPPLLRQAWTHDAVIAELRRRARRGDSGHALASACQRLFGSLEQARAAAGVAEPRRDEGMAGWDRRALIAELRRRRAAGRQLGRGLVEGLRREFGSLDAARALADRKRAAADGWQRWSRTEILERLRAWHAAGGEPSRQLVLACKQRFGSVLRACGEAGVPAIALAWTRRRVQRALRDPAVDVADPELIAACIEHFGSVTAARAAAEPSRRWSKAAVIAELQARSRRGLKGVGRLLRDPAIRWFGSAEAALQAAAQADPQPRSRRALER